MRGRPRRSRPGTTRRASSAAATCRPAAPGSRSTARRRFGIVTNFREFGRRRRSAPVARRTDPGVPRRRARRPASYLRSLETDAPGYAGFNLLLADRDSLWYASNRADQFARELPPGIYGLSNEFLDTPWPKLVRVRARFEALLADRPSADRRRRWPASLFAMLADRETAPPEACRPATCPPNGRASCPRRSCSIRPMARAARPYSRSSDDDALRIAERRFDADGVAGRESEYALNAATATLTRVRNGARNPRASGRLSLEFPHLPPVSGVMPTLQNNHRTRLPALSLLTLVVAQLAAPALAGIAGRSARRRGGHPRQRARLSIVRALQELRRPLAGVRRAAAGAQRARGARWRCAPSATTSRRSSPRCRREGTAASRTIASSSP